MTDKCAARKTPCDPDKVCNPDSGRCVLRTRQIGMRVLQQQRQQQQQQQQQQQRNNNKKKSNVPQAPQAPPNLDPITQNVIPDSHRVVVNRIPYDVTSLAALVHHTKARDPVYGGQPARLPLSRRDVTPAEAAAWTNRAKKLGWRPEAPATAINNANRVVPAHLRAPALTNVNHAARRAQAAAEARNAAELARRQEANFREFENAALRPTGNLLDYVEGLGLGTHLNSGEVVDLQERMGEHGKHAFMRMLRANPHIAETRPVLLAILCAGEIGIEHAESREDWRDEIRAVVSMGPAAARVRGISSYFGERAPLHNYLSRGTDAMFHEGNLLQPLFIDSRVVGALLAAAPEIARTPDEHGRLPLHLLIANAILRYDLLTPAWRARTRWQYDFEFDIILTEEDVECARVLLAVYPGAKRIADRSGRTPLDYLKEFEYNERTKNSDRAHEHFLMNTWAHEHFRRELNLMLLGQARAIAELKQLLQF